MRKNKLHYAWFILLGIILIRGFAGGGINMTAALFLSPVSQEIGVGIGSLSLYFSITSIVLILWLPVAGKLINKYDIRLMALLGVTLQALSFGAFGLMNNVFGWYLLAIPLAMGSAILVNLLGPILINRWFVKKTGTIMGLQMFFVNLFGAVLQPLTSNLIAQSGWRMGYFVIGGLTFAVVVFTSLLLLKNKPQEKEMMPYGAEPSGEQKDALEAAASAAGISEKIAIRSGSFYLLLVFMIAITGVGVFTQHIPTYGAILEYSLKATGLALSLASIGSALGSIAIGLICDKIGPLKTSYALILIGVAAVFGFLFSANGFVLFCLSTFLHGLTSAGIMVLAPILTLQFYGQKDYEKIFAKVAMGAPFASIVLIPVYGFIYDLMNSYTYVLLGILALLLLAAVSISAAWKKRCTMLTPTGEQP